jgi:LemA protein
MKGTRNLTLLIILGLVIILGAWSCSGYNGLVKQDENVKKSWNNVQSSYQRRTDLIPNLIETVKGYAGHERGVLTQITEARSAAMSAKTIDDKIVAEQQLTSALQGLRVQVEAYPDFKANQNFLQLQEELSDIENKLAASRRFFNGATTEYNNAVETFPSNLIANNFGFKREIMFDLGNEGRTRMEEPPTIKF